MKSIEILRRFKKKKRISPLMDLLSDQRVSAFYLFRDSGDDTFKLTVYYYEKDDSDHAISTKVTHELLIAELSGSSRFLDFIRGDISIKAIPADKNAIIKSPGTFAAAGEDEIKLEDPRYTGIGERSAE